MNQESLQPKRVLVFNSSKRLIAIVNSALAAGKISGVSPQSVYYACVGRNIAAGKHYYRHLPDDIEITMGDLGNLKLGEYDELCGITREVYPTNRMTRVGKKYNKTKKLEKHEN